jgi:carbonic anhydrase
MKPRILLAALALGLGLGLPALAADWATIVEDRARRIEIDRDSVLQSDPGTKVAWGRIVLTGGDAAEAGYTTVKALNRYDCRARSFSTVKRVYLDAASHVIREERVVEPRPIAVDPRSVDERLWREVCKPPSVGDLARLAEEAGRVAEAANPPPLRHADLVDAPEARADAMRAREDAGTPEAEAREAVAEPAPGQAQPGHKTITEGTIKLPPLPQIALPKRPPAPAAAAEAPVKAMPEAQPEPAPEPARASPPPVRQAASPKPVAPKPVAKPVPKPQPKAVARKSTPAPKLQLARAAIKEEAPSATKFDAHALAMAHKEIHWGYEGAGGPAHWGKLNPAWKTCDTGERQSPIDIRDDIRVDLEPIQFNYVPTYFRILNNGHTVKISVGQGSRMTVMGRSFDLVQFHFHRPSEERIEGRAFDMVAHLVHKDLDGRLAVVAVLIERGQAHDLVQTLWNNLPLEQGHDYAPPQVSIDPGALLPQDPSYYTYMGSLTTPPCSEDVLWMVMKQPIQLSDEQIAIFARLYPNNARPVQPDHDRLIKGSR